MSSDIVSDPTAPCDPLVDAYRRATAARPAGGCPPPAALARLAAGDVTRREREPLVDHLAVCGPCAEEWRAARAIADWAGQESHRAAGAVPAARAWAPRFAWAAAALAVAAGAWLLAPTAPWRDGDSVRALPAAGLGHAVTPLHGARLAAAPDQLAWRRPAAAKVELFDAALVPIGDSGAAVRSPWRVPDELKRLLKRRGGRIYWRVVGAGAVGPEPSALAEFELPPAP